MTSFDVFLLMIVRYTIDIKIYPVTMKYASWKDTLKVLSLNILVLSEQCLSSRQVYRPTHCAELGHCQVMFVWECQTVDFHRYKKCTGMLCQPDYFVYMSYVFQIRHQIAVLYSIIYRGKKITCPGARDKLNFRQDKHIFPPNVRQTNKKFSASLFDNIIRTS